MHPIVDWSLFKLHLLGEASINRAQTGLPATLGMVVCKIIGLTPPVIALSMSVLLLTITQHTVGPALANRATHLILNFLIAALNYKEIGEMNYNHIFSGTQLCPKYYFKIKNISMRH